MTRLRFKYYMKLSFSDSVERHRFSLKCIPRSDMKQRIVITHKDVYPNSFISEGKDSFGNLMIYGYEESSHKYFFFDIEGEAETGINGLSEPAENSYQTDSKNSEYRDSSAQNISLFKYQTDVTRPGILILKYFDELSERYESESRELFGIYGTPLNADDSYNYALYVMHRLAMDFNYVSGVTDIQTTAEAAMECGTGVCQDYAHIMLSLCRLKKIPSRYVTGMMLGEGMSHAWVEVYSGDRWIGFDPTNSQLVGDYYIKIAHGRDYSDCLVNQGLFTGNVIQEQEICVNVEEIG